ncbi:hypothetical protein ASPZODRAFT_15704 [Penicilliopsis zonata CBS 506.65]|uniref:Cysteine-rich PDZ-binding protein n=1 Tax=Penicilliopsis zonata CBS 506.65 TaxID=1073090 RepID=A0A1L9SIJ6_9EURO|nr:hypothetical protein ASPZODRAFT_15704 [Penicilliopsis zonata CBS 506.65]OJJ47018.1 hypothetical protein ASPZODRAFT_15704 [Penicilliopsis zonata CBS 506.65]
MVCAKCQKKLKKTDLVTPGVKRKSEMYYGSPSTSLGGGGDAKSKATLGNTGISKASHYSDSKAKNPYAAYSSSCESCKTKTEQGMKFCQRCAYQKHSCPMCGKSLTGKSAKDQPIVQAQKFGLK